jgi:hypothetical protein
MADFYETCAVRINNEGNFNFFWEKYDLAISDDDLIDYEWRLNITLNQVIDLCIKHSQPVPIVLEALKFSANHSYYKTDSY